jgi:hypothetical protein
MWTILWTRARSLDLIAAGTAPYGGHSGISKEEEVSGLLWWIIDMPAQPVFRSTIFISEAIIEALSASFTESKGPA